jgi:serine/threonine protein kinase
VLSFYYILGESFNNCAILDDYEIGKVLGTGGFGKVCLAVDKVKKRKVAIKFIDVTEQRKYYR